MSLQRCQQETTSTEFVEWQEFFQMEDTHPKREDFYAAQIAMEVQRTVSKQPNALRLKNFLLTFEQKGASREEGAANVVKRTERSKAAWFALVGMGSKGTPTRTPPGG